MSRVELFDHFGVKIAEIGVNANRTWKIGEYGKCVFELPVNHSKCTEKNLQFGNLIYIGHEKLPPWGGVIDVPREWNKNTVTITAYSGEYILKFRRDDSIKKITSVSGSLFNYIINAANRIGDTRIKADYTLEDEEAIAWDFNLLDMYSEVIKLAEATNNEWILVPKVTNGEIEFLSQWGKIGVDTNYLLKEGFNIEANNSIITESGQIANDVMGIGTGSTASNKPKVTTKNEASIEKYGLRQISVNFNEEEYQSIEKGTKSELENKKNPKKTFSINALDIGNTWKYTNIGNKMYLQMTNTGFQDKGLGMDTQIRIIGMTYHEEQNKLEMNCEEEND